MKITIDTDFVIDEISNPNPTKQDEALEWRKALDAVMSAALDISQAIMRHRHWGSIELIRFDFNDRGNIFVCKGKVLIQPSIVVNNQAKTIEVEEFIFDGKKGRFEYFFNDREFRSGERRLLERTYRALRDHYEAAFQYLERANATIRPLLAPPHAI